MSMCEEKHDKAFQIHKGRMTKLNQPFHDLMQHLVSERHNDPEEQKHFFENSTRLNIKLLEKILKNPKYKPNLVTVISICKGYKVHGEQATWLLRSAGHALSPYLDLDLCYSFIINSTMTIKESNDFLRWHGFSDVRKLLGSGNYKKQNN